MTAVSYAQNGEDMVLARGFPRAHLGFYVDVGASDPIVDSVTKYFYDRGWCGVNIEPSAATLADLQSARPRDVNLGVAVGNEQGTASFYELPREMTGCSTLSQDIAEEYRRGGWEPAEHEIEIRTLTRVWEEHVGERTVDFLKIDVEGYESAVLAGTDLGRFRPRALVVEATSPGTPLPAYQEWEPSVLKAGYRFVLFDGLNRFYVREEDPELAEALGVPANYFDDFLSYRCATWKAEAEQHTHWANEAEAALARATSEAEAALARATSEAEASKQAAQDTQRQLADVRAAAADANERAESLERALERSRQRLNTSQMALRDARTELLASREALSAGAQSGSLNS